MQSKKGSDQPQQGQATTETQQQQSQGQRQQQQSAGVGGVAAQPWMTMQYPAAAMVMQHPMMPQHYTLPPPPHYMAAYHPRAYMQTPPHLPHSHYHSGGGHHHHQQRSDDAGEKKTIWVGDLHHWMDENYLHSCFASTGEIASVKVIRNKHTGAPDGYGFVEFHSHAMAEKVLQIYSVSAMPHTANQPFRLNWASNSTADKRTDNGSDLSIFVGDLAPDVTDSLLHETFASKYPSVKAAKVVVDANTGRSKGYGFVRFEDENERAQAMNEMNGIYCSSRAMRIGAATPRRSIGYQQDGYASNGTSAQGSQADADSTNTTIFVGGLDPSVSDEDLRQPFSVYGEIVSVKIPVGRGCGFVQFAKRRDAEEALQMLNGNLIGKQNVRLSWGRNPANKQIRGDFSNEWNMAYYGGAIYDGYGYALPYPHDPSMYAVAAAYGAYPVYGNQQQS